MRGLGAGAGMDVIVLSGFKGVAKMVGLVGWVV